MGQLVKRKVQWVPVLAELIPGWFQVFGLGHMIQGRFGMGLFIMFSYWGVQFINLLLSFVLIGYVTAPLTWLFFMIAAPMNANDNE